MLISGVIISGLDCIYIKSVKELDKSILLLSNFVQQLKEKSFNVSKKGKELVKYNLNDSNN